MKILVSGMTSRQTNPDASLKLVTAAALMKSALEDAGHDVDLRPPTIEEDYAEYDHVLCGVGPLQGMGTNRAYGALSAIIQARNDNKLTLYIDDPNIDKVMTELRRNVDDPTRMIKPFFAYKHEHDIAMQPHMTKWLAAGVRSLVDNAWPNLIVPFFDWAEFTPQEMYGKRCPQASGRIFGLDFTSYLPEYPTAAEPRYRQWITEDKKTDRWIMKQQLRWDVRHFCRGEEGKRKDPVLLQEYRQSIGVLQAPIRPTGWWDSRLGYAAQAGAVFCTRWQDTRTAGTAYQTLPDHVEYMSETEHQGLATLQAEQLKAVSPTRQETSAKIDSLLKTEAVL